MRMSARMIILDAQGNFVKSLKTEIEKCYARACARTITDELKFQDERAVSSSKIHGLVLPLVHFPFGALIIESSRALFHTTQAPSQYHEFPHELFTFAFFIDCLVHKSFLLLDG